MRMSINILMLITIFSTLSATASDFLEWSSAVIQCRKTPEAGEISCKIKTNEDAVWSEFVIQAFGKIYALSATDLKKLTGFPLSSLHTTHEAGYERFGGYTISFHFDRTFYTSEKKLITEIIHVCVTTNRISVSDPILKPQ